MLLEFDFEKPKSLDEALALMANNSGDCAHDSGYVPLAGGSNIMPAFRAGVGSPKAVVDLNGLDQLQYIKVKDGRVCIGGQTKISDILNHPDMPTLAPSLHQCSVIFAGQMVRNVATVAGNVSNGSPACDSIPPLLSLDAQVVLSKKGGQRVVPLDEYFTGYKQNVRCADELITEISWPVPADNSVNSFKKVGRRIGDAITMVGVAVRLEQKDGICTEARIALGSVGPFVYRSKRAEEALLNNPLTEELIEEAANIARADSSPIDDVRATGEYRKHVVGTVTRRLLLQAAGLETE